MTAGDLESSLLGRIVRPADYVRVLATPLRLRSPHFALHYLEGRPLPPKRLLPRSARLSAAAEGAEGVAEATDAPVTASLSTELSTALPAGPDLRVDDSPMPVAAPGEASPADAPGAGQAATRRWLGLVVPKKHAKRAVTRVLVKRQIRHIVADCADRLAPGLWVVRQRSPFDPKQYPSAASDALKQAARIELLALFERAARGEQDKLKPRPTGAPARGAGGQRGKTGPALGGPGPSRPAPPRPGAAAAPVVAAGAAAGSTPPPASPAAAAPAAPPERAS